MDATQNQAKGEYSSVSGGDSNHIETSGGAASISGGTSADLSAVALVGRQFPLRILDEERSETEEFFIDLLFYNYLLRRFVVIDLKVEDFKPEFSGKMGFYLTAVDELERQPGDEPSIGLVLCPGRSKTVTEWALRTVDAPVAVARYTTGEVTLTQTPPPSLLGF